MTVAAGLPPSKRIRILTVTNTWPRATFSLTSGIFVKQLVDSLATVGVESDVYVIKGRESARAYVTAPLAILRRWRRGRYDLIHAYYGLSAAVAAVWKIPLVVTLIGSDVNDNWQRLAARVAARRARAVICVSSELAVLLGVNAEIIPFGVDADLFRAAPDRDVARRILGWNSDAPYVLFPGNPRRPVKNYPLYREVMERLRRAGVDAREVVLDGRYSADELPMVLKAADVLLMTSHTEGSPQAIKEALAADLPIVAADVGDVRWMTQGVVPGWVGTHDPEALTNAVRSVLTPLLRSNGSHRLRDAQLDWHNVALRTRAVYERVLSTSRTARW